MLVILCLLFVCGCQKSEEAAPIEPVRRLSEEEIDAMTKAAGNTYVGGKNVYLLQAAFDAHKRINPDVVAEFWFESGLIDQTVVRSRDNVYYERREWRYRKHDSSGAVFMDYRNTGKEQNVLLYGHYVYPVKDPEKVKMFTPLCFLTQEENYEANKTVYLFLGEQLRRYSIASVYYCKLINNYRQPEKDTEYYWTEYDSKAFAIYSQGIARKQFYDTGIKLEQTDSWLTLQTCVENHDELREIVLCRLEEIIPVCEQSL